MRNKVAKLYDVSEECGLPLRLDTMPPEILRIIFKYGLSPIDIGNLYLLYFNNKGMKKLLKSNLVWSNPYFWSKVPDIPKDPEALYNQAWESVSDMSFFEKSLPRYKSYLNDSHNRLLENINYVQAYMLAKLRPVVLVLLMPDIWKYDEQIWLSAIESNSDCVLDADVRLMDIKRLVMAAVKKSGVKLQYASRGLQSDRDVAFAAVENNGWSLRYLTQDLRKDKDVVLKAVKQNGLALRYAQKLVRSNRKVILAAVKQNGDALKNAVKELRSDKAIVLAAVKQNGDALKHAVKELRSDKAIVLAAVEKKVSSFTHAAKSLKQDKRFLLECMDRNKDIWGYLPSEELRSWARTTFCLRELYKDNHSTSENNSAVTSLRLGN